MPDPYCEASILSDSQGSLFLANPSHPGRRLNFSVHRSFDGGRSWPTSVVVYAGDAGYSDMAFVRNGSLAVFFEKDFAVNSVAFGVVPLPPLKPLLPLKPPYRASEVGGGEVESLVELEAVGVAGRVVARRDAGGTRFAPAAWPV